MMLVNFMILVNYLIDHLIFSISLNLIDNIVKTLVSFERQRSCLVPWYRDDCKRAICSSDSNLHNAGVLWPIFWQILVFNFRKAFLARSRMSSFFRPALLSSDNSCAGIAESDAAWNDDSSLLSAFLYLCAHAKKQK